MCYVCYVCYVYERILLILNPLLVLLSPGPVFGRERNHGFITHHFWLFLTIPTIDADYTLSIKSYCSNYLLSAIAIVYKPLFCTEITIFGMFLQYLIQTSMMARELIWAVKWVK